jgi:hypothetical protein
MQDDKLLSGSIADNICFFDESFELDHMVRCAELAGIHDEICRMPMAYNSLIGDMRTSLSGGQKQRVLLARALYRRPRLLFMDEGTSHLDIATERQVTPAVKALGLTVSSSPTGPRRSRRAGWCCTTANCTKCRRGYSPRNRRILLRSQHLCAIIANAMCCVPAAVKSEVLSDEQMEPDKSRAAVPGRSA